MLHRLITDNREKERKGKRENVAQQSNNNNNNNANRKKINDNISDCYHVE